jgi:hypothetical protein
MIAFGCLAFIIRVNSRPSMPGNRISIKIRSGDTRSILDMASIPSPASISWMDGYLEERIFLTHCRNPLSSSTRIALTIPTTAQFKYFEYITNLRLLNTEMEVNKTSTVVCEEKECILRPTLALPEANQKIFYKSQNIAHRIPEPYKVLSSSIKHA